MSDLPRWLSEVQARCRALELPLDLEREAEREFYRHAMADLPRALRIIERLREALQYTQEDNGPKAIRREVVEALDYDGRE